MNGRRPGNPAIHPKGAAGAFRQLGASEQQRQRCIGKRGRTGSVAVLAELAGQTGQDRKDPADQVEAGLLDRARL